MLGSISLKGKVPEEFLRFKVVVVNSPEHHSPDII
jgi:hypothetical protein